MATCLYEERRVARGAEEFAFLDLDRSAHGDLRAPRSTQTRGREWEVSEWEVWPYVSHESCRVAATRAGEGTER